MIYEHMLQIRLDRETNENLARLACKTERSRAGLIRWLVNCYASGELVAVRPHTFARPCLTDRAPEGDKP
jgi:hypothetical protein